MIRLAKYLKGYLWQILAVAVLVFIQVNCDLALPDYMSQIVDEGIAQGQMEIIWWTGLKMLGVSLLGVIATILVGMLAARVAAGAAMRLRGDVFARTEQFSLAEFDRFSTASLITRTTNDIQQMQMVVVMMLRFVISAPIMGIGGVMRAIDKSVSMSWIIAIAVILIVGLVIVMFSLTTPKFKIIQKMVDKLNLVTREGLTGVMVIRAFGNQKIQEEKFDETNRDLTRLNLTVNRLMVLLNPLMMLVMNFTTVAIVWVGAKYIDLGTLQVGNMMAFIQYAMQIMMAFIMISVVFIMLPRAGVSANRVADVLETAPSVTDPAHPENMDTSCGAAVEFKNVTFAYPDAEEAVLKDISFTARPGETTAFIGSTGSGKSTLINLVPRFYDVTQGEILIGGTDIRKVTQHELHDKIGYVPQRGILFSGTIASNMRYAKEDASQTEIEEACAIAQAADFIAEKEEGYASEIAQGGNNVSGGQRQRLSIARALVKKPDIYIFDDSFSALDFKTDAALRAALKEKTKGATVLIVAQRINTIMGAEQIVVLDEGRIVGKGTHRELLKSCEVYQQIARSQLSEEELA